MQAENLVKRLAVKGADKEKLAASVIKQRNLVPVLVEGLQAEEPTLRFACARLLQMVSEKEPGIVYPEIGAIVQLLDSNSKILKWGGIHTIGNLAVVDAGRRIDRILDRYLELLPGPDMVTAANVIRGAARIALAKPELTDKVVKAIMLVEKGRYRTPTCHDVVLGTAIDAFDRLYEKSTQKRVIAGMVRRRLTGGRAVTRKKAEKFVTTWLEPGPSAAKAASKPEPTQKTAGKSAPKAAPKAQSKAKLKPAPKPKAKPASKPKAKAKAKPAARTAKKSEIKPAGKRRGG